MESSKNIKVYIEATVASLANIHRIELIVIIKKQQNFGGLVMKKQIVGCLVSIAIEMGLMVGLLGSAYLFTRILCGAAMVAYAVVLATVLAVTTNDTL